MHRERGGPDLPEPRDPDRGRRQPRRHRRGGPAAHRAPSGLGHPPAAKAQRGCVLGAQLGHRPVPRFLHPSPGQRRHPAPGDGRGARACAGLASGGRHCRVRHRKLRNAHRCGHGGFLGAQRAGGQLPAVRLALPPQGVGSCRGLSREHALGLRGLGFLGFLLRTGLSFGAGSPAALPLPGQEPFPLHRCAAQRSGTAGPHRRQPCRDPRRRPEGQRLRRAGGTGQCGAGGQGPGACHGAVAPGSRGDALDGRCAQPHRCPDRAAVAQAPGGAVLCCEHPGTGRCAGTGRCLPPRRTARQGARAFGALRGAGSRLPPDPQRLGLAAGEPGALLGSAPALHEGGAALAGRGVGARQPRGDPLAHGIDGTRRVLPATGT